MHPQWHIFLGLIFTALVYAIFPSIELLGFLVIFFSSFLIDIDHYIYYFIVKKNFNLKLAFIWLSENLIKIKKLPKSERKKIYNGLYFLHGLDIILLLIILSYFNKFFLFIALGFIFHQFLDVLEIYYLRVNYDKIISFVYSLITARNKKQVREYKA